MEKNVWGKGYFLLSKIQHFLNWSLHPLPLLIKLVTPDFLKGFHTNFFFAPVGCQSNSKLQVFFFFFLLFSVVAEGAAILSCAGMVD